MNNRPSRHDNDDKNLVVIQRFVETWVSERNLTPRIGSTQITTSELSQSNGGLPILMVQAMQSSMLMSRDKDNHWLSGVIKEKDPESLTGYKVTIKDLRSGLSPLLLMLDHALTVAQSRSQKGQLDIRTIEKPVASKILEALSITFLPEVFPISDEDQDPRQIALVN